MFEPKERISFFLSHFMLLISLHCWFWKNDSSKNVLISVDESWKTFLKLSKSWIKLLNLNSLESISSFKKGSMMCEFSSSKSKSYITFDLSLMSFFSCYDLPIIGRLSVQNSWRIQILSDTCPAESTSF